MKNVRVIQNAPFEKYRNFSPFLAIVEKKLGETIISIEDLFKFYGIKSNNSTIKTIDKKGSLKQYVLKRSSSENIINEFRGTELISKYLPVAKVFFTFKVNGESWLLRDYISGVSMADITNYFEPLKNIQQLLEFEKEKERIIVKGYKKFENKINSTDYLVLPTNKLFNQRLFGERYRDFYIDGEFIPQYIHKRVVLNCRKFPLTLAEIFQNLRDKYSQTREMAAFPGHGDGHHGNVLMSNEGKITFFDNEYSCFMPSYMDLSKPYYNDLLGMLFYYFHDRLLDYFSIKSYDEGKTTLNLKIKLDKKIDTRMEITKIKLQERRNFLKDSQNYLKLNDYLFMCHTLNKNPNLFPKKILVIFLAFSEILNEFDSFNPESIYSYF